MGNEASRQGWSAAAEAAVEKARGGGHTLDLSGGRRCYAAAAAAPRHRFHDTRQRVALTEDAAGLLACAARNTVRD